MKYYIIAGEASGDLHGSNLIKAIQGIDANADIRCWGGGKMQAAGATVVKHIKDLAFMGFVEVVSHLNIILKNIKFCKQDILQYQPDVLVLIDYPGFNLRIAQWAKTKNIKVAYYISPQIWAWKENRVKTIRQSVDKMLVILPFEKDFYKKHQYDVIYAGHPLTEVIRQELQKPLRMLSDRKIIALLPGSRKQEIKVKLPVMLAMEKHFPQYQFAVAGAPALDASFYQQYMNNSKAILIKDDTYNLLRQSKAAMVTSGTATLETALLGVPEVVCYKGNALSFWLAKKLVKVKYISLVNLILNKPTIKELVQQDLNEATLYNELNKLLNDTDYQDSLQSDYTKLWEMLGTSRASEVAANEIISLAMNNLK